MGVVAAIDIVLPTIIIMVLDPEIIARADFKLIGGLWRSFGGRRWYIDRRSVCDDCHSATAVATMCRSGYYRAECCRSVDGMTYWWIY